MSKLDDIVASLVEEAKKLGLNLDAGLIERVARGLGPSIYDKDASTVACSDAEEVGRVRDSFLRRKLGVEGTDEELNAAIQEVCEQMGGGSNRSKKRVLMYALLAVRYGKESVFDA